MTRRSLVSLRTSGCFATPTFVGTGESWPRYLRGALRGAFFVFWLRMWD
jgi:hypothetical protein